MEETIIVDGSKAPEKSGKRSILCNGYRTCPSGCNFDNGGNDNNVEEDEMKAYFVDNSQGFPCGWFFFNSSLDLLMNASYSYGGDLVLNFYGGTFDLKAQGLRSFQFWGPPSTSLSLSLLLFAWRGATSKRTPPLLFVFCLHGALQPCWLLSRALFVLI